MCLTCLFGCDVMLLFVICCWMCWLISWFGVTVVGCVKACFVLIIWVFCLCLLCLVLRAGGFWVCWFGGL